MQVGNAGDGSPPRNPAIILPTPKDNQTSTTTTTTFPSPPQAPASSEASGLNIGVIVTGL